MTNGEDAVFPPPTLLPPVVNPATVIPGEQRTKEGGEDPPVLTLPPWAGIAMGGWSGPGAGPPDGTGMAGPSTPGGPTPPAIEDGESEEDYLIRCTADLQAQGMSEGDAEAACQTAWNDANTARSGGVAHARRVRKRSSRSAE